MDGRLIVFLGFIVGPLALIGVTVAVFSSNPLAIFALIGVLIVGTLYLLTYREAFG